MQRILSTYRWVNHALTPSLLQQISAAGISQIEIFCASTHFQYRNPQTMRELADALANFHLKLHSLHAPTERNSMGNRESGQSISISDPERIRRQDAVDEVKRALEVAERIPFTYLIQHMGTGRQEADPRMLDAAFSSLEHLVVFAKQRGVVVTLENTPSEIGSPGVIAKFLRETHLKDLRSCFDTGHANIGDGIEKSWEPIRDRVVTTHIHDNHGEKDEHLLPYEGKLDWDVAFDAFSQAAQPLPFVLELKEHGTNAPSLDQIRSAFDRFEEALDRKGIPTAQA
jgi:sugar phosphate isomerase/epimerase